MSETSETHMMFKQNKQKHKGEGGGSMVLQVAGVGCGGIDILVGARNPESRIQ